MNMLQVGGENDVLRRAWSCLERHETFAHPAILARVHTYIRPMHPRPRLRLTGGCSATTSFAGLYFRLSGTRL